MSKRQLEISLSTIEVEYMASKNTSKEEIWFEIFGIGIGFHCKMRRIGCDN